MGLTENAKATMDGIVKYIEGDGLSKFVEKNLFLKSHNLDIPAQKWSSLNRLAVLSKTANLDCRGFNQWKDSGRRIKKGARCAYILVPMMAYKKKDDESSGDDDKQKSLIGFRCAPVFPSEATEGEPLPYEEEGFDLTKLPLKDVADHLGVKVSSGITVDAYGFFRPTTKDIVLGTNDVTTWLHELSHAIDNELPDKCDDCDFNEIVAELSSATLCKAMGIGGHLEHTKAYINAYKGKSHVAHALVKAADRVGKIFEYIYSIQGAKVVAA